MRARHVPAARKLNPASTAKRQRGDILRVIIGDSHGAKANHAALEAMLADVKSLAPDEIILLGDHVDCGGFLAQHHTLGYVAETPYTYESDIAAANELLDRLQSLAPSAKIEYIEGNHERRVETWAVTQTLRHRQDSEFLRRAFSPEFLLQLAARGIPYYRQGEYYDDLPLPGTIRRGKCFFTHGSITSVNAARGMVLKLGGNIIFGHIHRDMRAVIRTVNSGSIVGQSFGCLCELQPLWQHTNPTDWVSGYGIQFISATGNFLSIPIPIVDGQSLLQPLTARFK
jgi:predicted phosphodiesterase